MDKFKKAVIAVLTSTEFYALIGAVLTQEYQLFSEASDGVAFAAYGAALVRVLAKVVKFALPKVLEKFEKESEGA